MKGELARGLGAGLSVALGYLPVALTFGVLARQTGLTAGEAAGMSAWVYAGASQFLALRMIAAAASPLQIVLATFILNFRHFVMGASLAGRLSARRGVAAALSYWLTDETFVVASIRLTAGPEHRLSATSFLALGLTAYASWVAGTLAGALLGGRISVEVMGSLGIGLYALFIALLVPSIRKSWRMSLVAVAGALMAFALGRLVPALSEGWILIAATLAASALGTLIPGQPAAPPGPGAEAGDSTRPARRSAPPPRGERS